MAGAQYKGVKNEIYNNNKNIFNNTNEANKTNSQKKADSKYQISEMHRDFCIHINTHTVNIQC